MHIIKTEENAVLIDTKQGFNVWVDVWQEGSEFCADWNAYIFHLNNSKDMELKAFQENADNFLICTSLAIEYFENKGAE
jgi:hypothetical protein